MPEERRHGNAPPCDVLHRPVSAINVRWARNPGSEFPLPYLRPAIAKGAPGMGRHARFWPICPTPALSRNARYEIQKQASALEHFWIPVCPLAAYRTQSSVERGRAVHAATFLVFLARSAWTRLVPARLRLALCERERRAGCANRRQSL